MLACDVVPGYYIIERPHSSDYYTKRVPHRVMISIRGDAPFLTVGCAVDVNSLEPSPVSDLCVDSQGQAVVRSSAYGRFVRLLYRVEVNRT